MLIDDLANINRNKMLREIVDTNPLALLTLNSKDNIDFINNLLPYSTGFEIECDKKGTFRDEVFNRIPKILAVDCTFGEQRFRIPRGLNGFICLYLICDQLSKQSLLNYGSGIHYHVDMTETCKYIDQRIVVENQHWILKELDTWEYKGSYNSRKVILGKGGWLGFRAHKNSMYDKKTAEFRCGEMSFDYSHLVFRIIHANSIIKRVNQIIVKDYQVPEFTDELVTTKEILEYSLIYGQDKNSKIQRLLARQIELEGKSISKVTVEKETPKVDAVNVIKSRTKKMV